MFQEVLVQAFMFKQSSAFSSSAPCRRHWIMSNSLDETSIASCHFYHAIRQGNDFFPFLLSTLPPSHEKAANLRVPPHFLPNNIFFSSFPSANRRNFLSCCLKLSNESMSKEVSFLACFTYWFFSNSLFAIQRNKNERKRKMFCCSAIMNSLETHER